MILSFLNSDNVRITFSVVIPMYSARKSFGDNPKFTGDSFGNVKRWKWAFTNDQGQRVTLVLQHNLSDSDESMGNMLKLKLPDLVNAERICFNKTNPQNSDGIAPESETDWAKLITLMVKSFPKFLPSSDSAGPKSSLPRG